MDRSRKPGQGVAGWHFDRVLSATCSECTRPSIPRSRSSLRSIRAARCCWPRRKIRSACSGRSMAVLQIGDQEIRGGRQLVDTPLINAQDNRMVPNTFEAATLVSLPDKDRNYDYAVGYLWNVKQRDSERLHSDVGWRLPGSDVSQPRRGLRYGQIPADRRALACRDGLQRPGFCQHGFRPGRVRLQAAEAEFQIGLSARTSSINEALEPTCSRELLRDLSSICEGADDLCRMDFVRCRLDDRSGSSFYTPFGAKPNYTGMQQLSFDNANEKAIGGSVAYDFGWLAFPDLAPERGTRMAGAPSTPAPMRGFPIRTNSTFGYNIVPRKAR